MRNVLLMLVFATLAFGVSAAGSWVVRSMKSAAPTNVEPQTNQVPLAQEPVSSEASATPVEGAPDLPVAVRPRPVSVEEVLRFGMGLRKREEQLDAQQKALEMEQSRMQLAMADIRSEQQNIAGMQAKLEGQAEACRAILSEVQKARQEFSSEREQAQDELSRFDEARTEADQQELENIKTMSEWFQGMEPEKAAGTIKKLADEGKMDLAVKLLSNFEERDAAKVLSALDDYALMVELAERFKSYKRPPRKEARRR